MKIKWKYVLPAAGVLVAVLVIVLVVLLKEESYRVIQVSAIDGSAEVDREEIGLLDAYMGMMLQTRDDVEVEKESYLYLKLDEDKYVMMEPETRFHLEAAGSSENSKTVIQLENGAIVNRLDNRLSEDASYEVTTPNSTMAIRGTVFRVEVVPNADGTGVETHVSVYEGEVVCSTIQPDGSTGDEVVVVANDQTIVIRDTEEETIIVDDPAEVEYEELEQKVLEFIFNAMEEKEESGFTPETEVVVRNLLEGQLQYTVTFSYNGTVFATQKVTRGEQVARPMLQPTKQGAWEFDFSQEILKDTEISWKEE